MNSHCRSWNNHTILSANLEFVEHSIIEISVLHSGGAAQWVCQLASEAIIVLLLYWVIITANYIGKPVTIDNATNSGKNQTDTNLREQNSATGLE